MLIKFSENIYNTKFLKWKMAKKYKLIFWHLKDLLKDFRILG